MRENMLLLLVVVVVVLLLGEAVDSVCARESMYVTNKTISPAMNRVMHFTKKLSFYNVSIIALN